MTVHLRPLRIAAHVELISLIVMLANLATSLFEHDQITGLV